MNDYEKGKTIFGVGTNYDYYVVQNKLSSNNLTKVKDIDENNKDNKEAQETLMNLNKYDFIPSGKFALINKLLAKKNEDKVELLYGSVYHHTRTDKMSESKTDEYKYPCCYSITQKNGMSFYYSNERKEHFDIPKVIWSNGAGTYPIVDAKGEYALTEFCYAIADKKSELNKIKDAMQNPKFIELMKYLKMKKDEVYNYRIIGLFKKDFYKAFLY